MICILLRHGPAMPRDPQRWPDDGERPLSERGLRRTARAVTGLCRLVSRIDAVWSSPALRALQTAEILRNAHPQRPPLKPVEALRPDGSLPALRQALAALGSDDTVVLVGHEPQLGLVAATLLGGPRSRLSLPLKKAGAVCLHLDPGVAPPRAALEWWLPPSVLRRVR